ncbi:hypothetical protein HDU77_009386 [Chytriomyces hyalinus]|nr:hypothetical protein HDU77_009386 [Chytriomyces hyalinus]
MPSIEAVNTSERPASATKALIGAGISAAKDVVSIIDPYVPTTARTAAVYALKQTTDAIASTQTQLLETVETANAVKDAAYGRAIEVRTRALETAFVVLEKSGAVNVVDAANQRVDEVKKTAVKVAEGWRCKAVRTVESSLNLANSLLAGATGTLITYTPKTVVSLVQAAVDSCGVIRVEGLVALKPYVPAFVVKTTEQTFEIVENVRSNVHSKYSETTGFIVSRVNGTVDYVVAVPSVRKLLDRINAVLGRSPVSEECSNANSAASENGDSAMEPILSPGVGDDEFHDATTVSVSEKDSGSCASDEEGIIMKGDRKPNGISHGGMVGGI